MSFGVLKFGEKCDRHPVPKFRGEDGRAHIYAPARPKDQALKMQASGDWFKPLPKPGEEEEAPKRPLSAAQLTAQRQQRGSAGKLLQNEEPDEKEKISSKRVTPQLSQRPSSASTQALMKPEDVPDPIVPPTRAQQEEMQMTKNIQAGLRMPTNIPPPVRMDEVVQRVKQPESRPPPVKESDMSGIERLNKQLEFEQIIDGHVATIKKYIEQKSNFGSLPAQSQVLQKLLKNHCPANKEMSIEDFATALSVFNLQITAEEMEALFDRLDTNENGSCSFREIADGLLGCKAVPGQSPEARKLLADLRLKILKRNSDSGAVRGFTKSFQMINKDKDEGLTCDELFNGLQKIGIRVPLKDVERLVIYFDTGKDKKVSLNEFLAGLRGPMPRRRKKLVQTAYKILDENGDGNITLDEIAQRYNAKDHPQVKSGEKTEEEVLSTFIDSWDQSGDDIITWKEFLTYYKDVSAGIEMDDYFELMMRNAWHISGGEGWSANTANRRVLVTHTDGSQSVEELKNDLGIGPKDLDKMRAQLVKQGINDIKTIEIAG